MTFRLRPPRREDAAAIASTMNAFAETYGADTESAPDIASWFEQPGIDLDRDARVAVRDRAVVGYADVSDAARDGNLLYFDVRFDPEHLEVREPLLDFAEARAGELAANDASLKAWAPEAAGELRATLVDRGFAFRNYSFRMCAALDEDPPPPEWPPGIAIRTFRRDDLRAVYEAHQEAFSEEPDHPRDPFDEWQHWSFRAPFDPELWFLAFDGDTIAGVSLCRPERGGDDRIGWVSVLGVRKPWRRRGLALALLRHSFRELRARGKERVALGVDGRADALRLYERAGMARERTSVWYERSL